MSCAAIFFQGTLKGCLKRRRFQGRMSPKLGRKMLLPSCWALRMLAAASAASSVLAVGLPPPTRSLDRPFPAPPAKVVVAKDASVAELWSAKHLADLLALPIVHCEDEAQATDGAKAQLAVGHGAAVAMGLKPSELAALGEPPTALRFTIYK